MILATIFALIVERSPERSPKLASKCARGMNKQLLKQRQVLLFYSLGKNSEKPYKGGGGGTPLIPPCTTEGYHD